MQAHEVPTHVQAEDRVLLWFTFPQIVALTAVAALAYGAYSLAPFGPSGVRMALAILIGLVGVAAVAGKIGGRKLPLVAADLLRFWLGPRRYAGVPAELARSEPPPPPPSTPSPLRLMATRARKGLRKLRKNRTRRTGRRPFRAHCRFGKRFRRRNGERCKGQRVDIRSIGQRGGLVLLAVSVAVTTVFGGHGALVATGQRRRPRTVVRGGVDDPAAHPRGAALRRAALRLRRLGRAHPAGGHRPTGHRTGLWRIGRSDAGLPRRFKPRDG